MTKRGGYKRRHLVSFRVMDPRTQLCPFFPYRYILFQSLLNCKGRTAPLCVNKSRGNFAHDLGDLLS